MSQDNVGAVGDSVPGGPCRGPRGAVPSPQYPFASVRSVCGGVDERLHDVKRQRDDDRGILRSADLGQRLQIARREHGRGSLVSCVAHRAPGSRPRGELLGVRLYAGVVLGLLDDDRRAGNWRVLHLLGLSLAWA